mmetsp:Transcript_31837/g.101418  ORF Transcript_31837/g.101418 Transcript_31837/m.101418 type:complete len:262 (+) Transcript_31837:202-987(+)|eukprot:CAMPEP_0182867210 /NCGR_PEP_ID=MMETSP0034_2-20130328/8600_1 /TAXON_ID=156128 /ORGANISM="Nephroselmis pyriformis, Strain CCMP717" /LENGTH=261 /DNA_ID=CAMNT_0024999553 /DNA_START=160 /DNA_END=945 /DNA_ORIENTATION=-
MASAASGGSVAGKRKRVSVAGDTVDLLECPVCFEIMGAQIFQCSSGHTLCSGCLGRLHACPSCRCVFKKHKPIRCLALEHLAEKVKLSCEFEGCKEEVSASKMAEHKASCSHRPIRCPTCNQAFAKKKLWGHVTASHADMVWASTRGRFRLPERAVAEETTRLTYPTRYTKVKGNYVAVDAEVGNKYGLYFNACIRGLDENATAYTMSVSGKSRTSSFTGYSLSIRRSRSNVTGARDCLVVPINIAYYMADSDNCLLLELS